MASMVWQANLQQFKGCQHFSSGAVPTIDLIVLQLRREARGTVVLISHLDYRLSKGSAHEVSFTLQITGTYSETYILV